MDVLVLIVGFFLGAAAGWAALKAEVGSILSVLIYSATFLAVVGVGVLVRRWRQ